MVAQWLAITCQCSGHIGIKLMQFVNNKYHYLIITITTYPHNFRHMRRQKTGSHRINLFFSIQINYLKIFIKHR